MTNKGRAEQWRAWGVHTDERVGWIVDRATQWWPDSEAIVFEGRRLTYRQLWRWTTVLAGQLFERGVGPGDRLLWQLPNSLEGLVLHLAAWRVGAVCVPVVPMYREHEMGQILQEVHPRAVAFAGAQGDRSPAEEADRLMTQVGISPQLRIAVGDGPAGWMPLPAEPDDTMMVTDRGLPDPLPAGECCLVLYTSGTTTAPKGVCHASTSLVAEAQTWRLAYGFGSSDVFLMGAPISHIAGLLLTLVVPASIGAKVVLLPSWNPDRAVALAESERATFCAGASVFLEDFVSRYEQGHSPEHRLSLFLCGGAAVPPRLIERADACGIKAWRCYGLTEAPTVTLARPGDPLERRAFSDGPVSVGTEVEAVDDARRPLPPGHIGELRLRSPEQMLGYTDPAATAAQVDSDGWFYTGDVGHIDEEGWVTMTGRIKDIVNRGGEKFSCQDIEQLIAAHPAIAAAAVVGVPDGRLGERVAAFVTLRPGSPWPGRHALIDHLEGARLARQKLPVEWRILEALPVTMSGKIQKHRLLAAWTETLERQGNPT